MEEESRVPFTSGWSTVSYPGSAQVKEEEKIKK